MSGALAARLRGDTTVESKAVKVLLVEDNAGDARLLRQMFSKEKAGSFEWTHLSRMSEAVAHLARGGVDIVLLDMGLPDGQGIENLRRARAAAPDVAMIVLTCRFSRQRFRSTRSRRSKRSPAKRFELFYRLPARKAAGLESRGAPANRRKY